MIRTIFVLLVIALDAIAPLDAQYSNRLKINHAQYGRRGVGADGTNKVRRVIHNSLSFAIRL
jgi:hypothetical protein